jgi:hypothetical protein
MKVNWETVLFFSSIAWVCASIALITGTGASIVLLDPHPFYWTAGVWLVVTVLELVAGAKT